MQTENAKIISAGRLAEGIYELWLDTRIARDAKPGQFVMVYPNNETSLLGRPVSICRIGEDKGSLRLVYRVAGKGTAEFSLLKEGDEIKVLGPCGNGYDTDSCRGEVLLVGGGIGLPPMLELGCALKREGKSFYFVMGYRNSDTFLREEFEAVSGKDRLLIASDDGSVGVKGTVIDAIRQSGVGADVICACGPLPMLRALKEYAALTGAKAYVSLEERMACGVGACLGCVCKTVRKDEHSRVNNARVCVEGPVFDADLLEL